MSNLAVNNYITVIDRLDIESKLALLSALTDSIRNSLQEKRVDKSEMLYRLYGAWSDVEEDILADVYSHRVVPEDEISFD